MLVQRWQMAFGEPLLQRSESSDHSRKGSHPSPWVSEWELCPVLQFVPTGDDIKRCKPSQQSILLSTCPFLAVRIVTIVTEQTNLWFRGSDLEMCRWKVFCCRNYKTKSCKVIGKLINLCALAVSPIINRSITSLCQVIDTKIDRVGPKST